MKTRFKDLFRKLYQIDLFDTIAMIFLILFGTALFNIFNIDKAYTFITLIQVVLIYRLVAIVYNKYYGKDN